MSQTTLPRTLGEQEALLLSKLSAAGHRIFTVADARAVFGRDGAELTNLLYRLCAKRWLERLERGKYLLIPLEASPDGHWAEHEYLVAGSLVEPYYLAYATALHYYGYTEGLPRPIWIATTRRKAPVTIGDIPYRFVTLSEHKFFGYTTAELHDTSVRVAEREKAIADGFNHPEYCGGVTEVAKSLGSGSDELDLEKLVEYSRRLDNRAAMRRLGFWLELLQIGDEALWGQLEHPGDRNYARLDPQGPKDGPRNARWRLIINIPEQHLLKWREH